MADIGSLPSFLSDVADAIRETSATDEKFTPSEFDEKIRNIPRESSGIEKIQKNGIDLEIVNKTVNIELDKSDVGLSNVENTSDMEKPISNLQKKEFEKKADKSEIPDVSNYITATVDNLENYYSKLEIDNKGFLTSIPDEYITEEELESKNYVTENYVDEKFEEVPKFPIGDTLSIGSIMPYPKAIPPENWLICDGSAVSRTDYSELFNVIGVNFGNGDGSTTFNLPDIKGRTIVGLDTDDTDFNTIGKVLGEKTHTLTVVEMPTHSHVNQHYVVSDQARNYRSYEKTLETGTTNAYLGTADTNDNGGNQPHNNIQPSFVIPYIIKAKQSAGLVATVVDNLDSTSATDALSAKQGKELSEKITKNSTYSTTEQAVGTWIDGKTIYRKVINFGALPNATKKDVAHNISNLEQFTKVEGIATRQDDTKFTQPLPLVYKEIESNYNSSLGVDIQTVSIQTGEDRSMFNGYVILEYTKTTD